MSLIKQIREKFSTKGLNAYNLFSVVKYGEILDEKGIQEKFIKEITETIQNRASTRGMYSTVIDLETANNTIIEFITQYFQSKGFRCHIIDNKILDFVDSPKLYIEWSYA